MKKAGWTIYAPFMVLSGLEKGFTLDVVMASVNGHFPLYLAIFGMVTTNHQTTRWSWCKPALDQWKGRWLVKHIHGHWSLLAKSYTNLCSTTFKEKLVHSPQGAPELTSVNFEDLSWVGNPFESLCEQCSLHSAVSPSRCKLSGVGIVKVILEIPARRCIEGRFSTKSAPTVARVLRIVQRGQHQYQGEWFKEDAGIKERCTRV